MVQSYGNVTTKGTQLSNQKVISKQRKFLVLLHQRDTQTTAAILNSSLTCFLAPRKDSWHLFSPCASKSFPRNRWPFSLSPPSHSTSRKPKELVWSPQGPPQRWSFKRPEQARPQLSDGLTAGRD